MCIKEIEIIDIMSFTIKGYKNTKYVEMLVIEMFLRFLFPLLADLIRLYIYIYISTCNHMHIHR